MKLSDIYNSICIDSSVENKNCILLKIVFYLTKQFIYKSAWLWNEFCKIGSFNFNSSCNSVKHILQKSLMNAQNRYGVEWNDKNFTEF